ncbi:MAG: DUF5602 domain-containing protein [Bacteroidia bacterium]|nr:DUF5602 domain-containing protein [Bacteroidia bacterium]
MKLHTLSFASLITLLLIASSCKKPEDLSGEYTAAPSYMGNGYVFSWVNVDNFNKPKSIGFTFNTEALAGLDTSGSGHTSGGHNPNIIELAMPAEAANVVYNSIVINWNPKGHVPNGVYDTPHFDFHFYSMPTAERKAIPNYEQDSLKFKNLAPKDYFPANYISPGGGDPEMGTHLVDLNARELNGKAFDETFVYGSYNGKVNFIEPMITMAFLQKTTQYSRSIPRPAKVMVSGYYPRVMCLKKVDNYYSLSLEDMEYRLAE